MEKRNFWLGILALAMVFGMMVVGCEDGSIKEPTDDRPMGSPWTMVSNPPFGTGEIYDIAYGDGKFIAVGYSSGSDSKIAYSTDGVNWSLVNNLPSSIFPRVIAYGGGKWVTNDAHSSDGLNWSEATSKLSLLGFPIAYGDGKFVGVGSDNKIAYSTDGQTWTAVSNPPFVIDGGAGDINGIAYGDGKFVAVGYRFITSTTVSSRIAYSTDGITWTSVSPAVFSGNIIRCIAYGGGKFVASSSNATAYSTDGISWTPITQNKLEGEYYYISKLGIAYVAYGNGKWVGLDTSTSMTMGYSSDGINWTPAFNPPEITVPRGVTYGNGKFVVIGSNGSNNGRIAYSIQ